VFYEILFDVLAGVSKTVTNEIKHMLFCHNNTQNAATQLNESIAGVFPGPTGWFVAIRLVPRTEPAKAASTITFK
jgi:hypothetical protein